MQYTQPFITAVKPVVYPHKISGSATECYAAELSSTFNEPFIFF